MSGADDLMREAHTLADMLRRRRLDDAGRWDRETAGVTAMETRLARLWMDIRAARAAGNSQDAGPPSSRRTRPKWG